MINKPLEQITIADINELKENSVAEGKSIEYKEKIKVKTDSEKKEFLADVSSFANTIGGDLIFGIEERKGVPVNIMGIIISDKDKEISRLENIIRDGIEPRIQYSIWPIELENKNIVLIIRINKSWIGPHRVIYQSHDKFYARNSSGKYPMDTMELRTAFNLSETLVEKIRNFRLQRISEISTNQTPIPFRKGGKIILHSIPFEAFSPNIKYDLDIIANNPSKLLPLNAGIDESRYNLEGFLTYSLEEGNKSLSYAQIYRNGIIEAVEGALLETANIPIVAFEKELLISIPRFLKTQKELGIFLPIFIFLSLAGVEEYLIETEKRFILRGKHYHIDRDILNLPESVIDDFETNPEEVLRPMFDIIWNACGYPRSSNFSKDGKWRMGNLNR